MVRQFSKPINRLVLNFLGAYITYGGKEKVIKVSPTCLLSQSATDCL
jgi:hypothetical protein